MQTLLNIIVGTTIIKNPRSPEKYWIGVIIIISGIISIKILLE